MPPAAPPRSGAGCGSSAMAAPYAFAVIPARGGSKGLPGKNLKALTACYERQLKYGVDD